MPKVSRSRRRNSRSNTRRSTRRSRSRSNRRSRRVSRRTLRSRSRRSLRRGGSGFRVPKGTPNYKTIERQRIAALESAPASAAQVKEAQDIIVCKNEKNKPENKKIPHYIDICKKLNEDGKLK